MLIIFAHFSEYYLSYHFLHLPESPFNFHSFFSIIRVFIFSHCQTHIFRAYLYSGFIRKGNLVLGTDAKLITSKTPYVAIDERGLVRSIHLFLFSCVH